MTLDLERVRLQARRGGYVSPSDALALLGMLEEAESRLEATARDLAGAEAALLRVAREGAYPKPVPNTVSSAGWPTAPNTHFEVSAGTHIKVPASHGMVPGSHERPGGPLCRCGGAWLTWANGCLQEARSDG